MTRCPNGHFTSAADRCDICGAPLDPGTGQAGPVAEDRGAAAAAPDPGDAVPVTPRDLEHCPSCGTPHGADALSCQTCGFDLSAAGESGLSDVPGPAGVGPWVVEVGVDPAWYAESQSPDPMPLAGPPRVVVLTGRSALVGRPSASRNIHPDVDCSSDTGVSRRHAQLTTDGTRFFVEDLESANGTFVGPSGGPLPDHPVGVGVQHELDAGARVYIGAWTRLVVRPATEDEQA